MRLIPDDFIWKFFIENGFAFILLQIRVGGILFNKYFPIFRDKKTNKIQFRKLNKGLLWWFVGVALVGIK